MSGKVLVYSQFPKAMMVPLGERYDLLDSKGRAVAEMFSPEQLSQVRVLISAGATLLPAQVMDLLPSLKAIVCYGTGYDGVDLTAAAARGIAVGHSPAANAAAVADLALTLMLAVTRRLVPADAYVRSGDWAAATPSPQMAPRPGNPGRRVGVYGMGA
ncbi:MAG: 2-hydroxyacid dehydrogenase, partial [Rhizobiales bacterium]|nr:2-hydroxyacid dehydrogenase [Hyphomicrobiales bacterium]